MDSPGRTGLAPIAGTAEVDYPKLIGLFTASHSSDLYDRHVGVVDRVCRVNSAGFAIRDLLYIDKILTFLIDRIVSASKADIFGQPLCKLLRTLALPFVRRTATDEFKMFNNISQICLTVSRTFNNKVPADAQIAAAEMLAAFASAHGARPSVVDDECEIAPGGGGNPRVGPSPRQYHTNQGLLERSGCVQNTVIHGFRAALLEENEDPALQLALTRAVLQFSYHPGNALLMLNVGVLEAMAAALAKHFHDPIVFNALELAWNLLENSDAAAQLAAHDAVCAKFCTAVTLQVDALLQEGYSVADKELRNEFFLMAEIAARQEPTRLQLLGSGFLKLAVAVSTSPEVAVEHTKLKPFTQTKDKEDYECKRFSLAAVATMCASQECLEEAHRLGFMQALLCYLDPEQAGNPAVTRWLHSQRHDMTLHVLSILTAIVPACPETFREARAGAILCAFIADAPKFGGEQQQLALRLLRTASALPQLQTLLGEEGAINITLDLFMAEGSPEVLRQDAVAVLSHLCRNHEANARLFRGARGLSAVKQALAGLWAADHTLPSAYGVAVLECLWNAVVGSRRNLARFLAAHGLDALFDLLEVCNPYLYPVILSCMADIAENPKTHEFFHEWKSSTSGQTLGHMILGLWRAEEKARGMLTEEGSLANPARPMAGTLPKRAEWIPSLDIAYTFQSNEKKSVMKRMAEVVNGDAIVVKVYAVLSKLGFENFPYLDHTDHSTLCTIENFVKFRQGEVWQDISAEFAEEAVKPTAADRQRLASGIQKSEALARNVVYKQGVLHTTLHEEHEAANAEFYSNTMQLAKDEAEAKVYKRSMATLTMKERLEAKLKREQMLKTSFKEELTKERFKACGLDMDAMLKEEAELTLRRSQGLPLEALED